MIHTFYSICEYKKNYKDKIYLFSKDITFLLISKKIPTGGLKICNELFFGMVEKFVWKCIFNLADDIRTAGRTKGTSDATDQIPGRPWNINSTQNYKVSIKIEIGIYSIISIIADHWEYSFIEYFCVSKVIKIAHVLEKTFSFGKIWQDEINYITRLFFK